MAAAEEGEAFRRQLALAGADDYEHASAAAIAFSGRAEFKKNSNRVRTPGRRGSRWGRRIDEYRPPTSYGWSDRYPIVVTEAGRLLVEHYNGRQTRFEELLPEDMVKDPGLADRLIGAMAAALTASRSEVGADNG